MAGGTACDRGYWGLRWSYGVTKRAKGVPTWVVEPHANTAAEAFGGVPYGATERVRGVPIWG
eukprot:2218914-Pyramimonas_sp.AAC.1